MGDVTVEGCQNLNVQIDVQDEIVINEKSHPVLYKIRNTDDNKITSSTLFGLMRDLYKLALDDANDFDFNIESMNGTKRKIVVLSKISTPDSFR